MCPQRRVFGVKVQYVYDDATGAPTGISSGIGPAHDVQQLTYSWDGFGNLQQRCDTNQLLAENFNYDGLNRLLQSNVNSGVPSACPRYVFRCFKPRFLSQTGAFLFTRYQRTLKFPA